MSAEDWKGIVKVIRKDIDDVQQASKEAQAAIIAESQRELRPTRVTPPHLLKLLFEDDESGWKWSIDSQQNSMDDDDD